ncbi:MAG: M23 family metallopeptidase, partial [Chloroflexi bacterium]|nr:M23 family metallopeptidase [Chloroflexota bacterium]
MGVDLADMRGEERIAYAGLPVHLVLSGRVAGVILDRFPYGNAVLVETSLEDLPAGWAAALQLPTPAPTLETHSSLTCPSGYSPASWDASRRALYLLYAHLQAAPLVQPGESVACGQVIGAIGDSGNALAPHLHLEARLGPAGAQFASLAHYDDTASLEEMENYCTWRISQLFQLIDPFTLLH